MNIKQNLRNVLVSILSIILFDIIYSTIGASLVINNLKIRDIRIVTILIAVGLFAGLLYAGYLIGKKLCCNTKKRGISIVLIPMILLLLLFGVGTLTSFAYILMMMQYPAAVLGVPLGFSQFFDNYPMLYYATLILYHLICCLSLLIGSYHKEHKQ